MAEVVIKFDSHNNPTGIMCDFYVNGGCMRRPTEVKPGEEWDYKNPEECLYVRWKRIGAERKSEEESEKAYPRAI